MDRRAVAVFALLTETLPGVGLERIGYRYTVARDPKRSPDAIKQALGRAYVEWRRQHHDDASAIVSLRRQKGAAVLVWRRRA